MTGIFNLTWKQDFLKDEVEYKSIESIDLGEILVEIIPKATTGDKITIDVEMGE